MRVGTSGGGWGEFAEDDAVRFAGLAGVEADFEEAAVGPLLDVAAGVV